MNQGYLWASLTILVLMLATELGAQVPVPRPSPPQQGGNRPQPQPPASRGPKVSSPGEKPATLPARTPTKRDLEDRKAGSPPTNSGTSPGSRPTGGPGPAGPTAPEKSAPSLAEQKAADRRVELWSRSLRPARREHWTGHVVFLDKSRMGKSLPIQMWLERNEACELKVRFQQGRFGDLPDAQVLSLLNKDGQRDWWRLLPEEGAEIKSDDGRSGPLPDLLHDLIPVEPSPAHGLKYLDADLMDARRILVFGFHDGRPGLVSLRPDLNLVTRVEILDDAHEKALRELRFSTAERRGVHRRFVSVMRHDFVTGESVRIDWDLPKMNPDLPEDFFEPPALLKTLVTEKKATSADAKDD